MLIICNGMVRSGSTLQYNLVSRLVESLGLGVGEGFFRDYQIEALIVSGNFRKWDQDPSYHVIKIHGLHPKLREMVESSRLSPYFFYIYRDIRDVALSVKLKLKYTGEELIDYLDRAISTHYEIEKFKDENFIWEKYEDVVRDTSKSIYKYAEFLDLHLSQSLVSEIGLSCSLETAQNVISQTNNPFANWVISSLDRIGINLDYSSIGVWDRKTLLHPNHISENSGRVGSWETQLSSSEKELLIGRYKEWLSNNNY